MSSNTAETAWKNCSPPFLPLWLRTRRSERALKGPNSTWESPSRVSWMHFDRKILLTERSMLSPPPPLKSLYRVYGPPQRKANCVFEPILPHFQSKHGMAFYPDKVWPKLQFFLLVQRIGKKSLSRNFNGTRTLSSVASLGFSTLSSNCDRGVNRKCVHGYTWF